VSSQFPGQLAFSADGTKVAVCSTELRIVDLTGPRPDAPTVEHFPADASGDEDNYGCQFGPDGHVLVARRGSTVAVVRLTGGEAPRPLVMLPVKPLSGRVFSIGLSHDGRTLAVAQVVDKVQPLTLWDVSDPARPVALSTITTTSYNTMGLAFSQDDRTLVEVEPSDALRIFDLADLHNPRERYDLSTSGGVASSPMVIAGSLLALSGEYVWRWDLDVDRVATSLCAAADAALSEAEWARDLPDVDYQPSCG
jgi:WD40 repeat protein